MRLADKHNIYVSWFSADTKREWDIIRVFMLVKCACTCAASSSKKRLEINYLS